MKQIKIKPARTASAFSAHLAAYSATATVALLAAPNARATVQNINSATLTLTLGSANAKMPVNLGPFHGSFSGTHQTRFYNSANSFSRSGIVRAHGPLAVVGNIGKNLAPGANLVGNAFNDPGLVFLAFGGSYQTSGGPRSFGRSGNFLPAANGVKTGYVGFKARQNTQNYYGWLRVQVHADARDFPDRVSILADANGVVGAFSTDPSEVIVGAGAATPEPSTLAIGGLSLLALGARGVRELRRRRQTGS